MATSKIAPFAARLRQLRTAAGLTQVELARRAGTDQSSIARYESGREPAWLMIQRLADALGVPVESFRTAPTP